MLASVALVTGILIQIGAAGLILMGLGAIQKNMNLVVLCTAGGKLVVHL